MDSSQSLSQSQSQSQEAGIEYSLKEALHSLRLDKLDNAWVEDIWEREFMDDFPLPAYYEEHVRNISIPSCLRDIRNGLKNLNISLSHSQNDSEVEVTDDESIISNDSWKNYINYVKHEKLIAFLFHLINKGDAKPTVEKYRMSAILSARLYFVMLSIPGSKAYKVFHCQMVITCLKIFKFGERLLKNDDEDDIYDVYRRVNSVNKYIKQALDDLLLLIKRFNMKADEVSLEETISSLVDLMQNAAMNTCSSIESQTLSSISEIADNCMDLLIKNGDEEVNKGVINAIFKFLLPKFVSAEKNSKKLKVASQTAGYNYCSTLLSTYGDSALYGFTSLIQHLCCNSTGMERVENRRSRVKLIVGLLSLLPKQAYVEQLEWIVKLSRNSIPTWRSLALDVIGFILDGEDITDESDQDMNLNQSRNDEDSILIDDDVLIPIKRINVDYKDLVQVVVERCQDVSCTVRTNALAILVSCTSPKNETLNKVVKELFKNYDRLVNIAEQKLKDERVLVRRSAIRLLDNLLTARGELLQHQNLNLLVVLCRDASILVRTLAINTLTGLAIHWHCASVANAWLEGVMNQLSDPESKIQDIVLEALQNLLFSRLSNYNPSSSIALERFPWILLNAVITKNMRRHLGRACLLLSKKNNKLLDQRLVNILFTHVKTENNLSAWVLLSCIARFVQMRDVSFVVDYFNERKISESMFSDIRLLVLVQEVLCEWCPAISSQQCKVLQEQLIEDLHYSMIPSGATRGAVSLTMRLTRDEDFSWALIIMEEYQNKIISYANEEHLDMGGAIIITMGDLSLFAGKRPSEELVDLLAAMVGSFNDVNSGFISTATRAAAIAVLGKFSLRDRPTATRVTRLCGRLLSSTACPLPLMINAMCVLADMSIRFTAVVEPILPSMFLCLGNSDVIIRRMAVQLVTQLLVADFLKLKDALYFHYFTLVCDSDEKIRDIATYYLFQCLIVKDKSILYHNFVKSVFYYNNYNDPLAYKRYDVPEEERRMFSMEGEEKRSDRHNIYGLMLNHMSDLQRLNTQVRLWQQALAAGEVGIAGIDLLSDSLVILRKLSLFSQSREQNTDFESRVASTIVAQKMKLNDVEKVAPLVMRLYRQLKLIGSPLVSSIVSYACDLLKEYKNEFQIEEIFDADTDFLAEIRQFQTSFDSDFVLPGLEVSSSRKERRPSKMKTPIRSNSREDGPSRTTSTPTTTPKKQNNRGERKGQAKRTLNLNESNPNL